MVEMQNTQSHTLQELAAILGGQIENTAPNMVITGFATLASAAPDEVSFLASEKMADLAASSRAGLIVAPKGLDLGGRAVLRVPEIWDAVVKLIEIFAPVPPVAEGIDPTVKIGEGSTVGESVALGANVVIGKRVRIGARTAIGPGCTIGDDTIIGEDCILYPGVHILHRITIGSRVIIHPGVVIGSDGFKFEFVHGAWKKIPQVGTVVIEDDVEIGSNSTIDRAFLDETRICAGTKIDNQVQIAHNVKIGPNSLMCAHVGIAGSTQVGANCVFAGKVGVKDNVIIGNGVQVAATAAIKEDIPDGQILIGQPAIPMGEWSRIYAASRKGPEVLKRLRAVEIKVEKMEKAGE